jgi:hypothetical protein
VNSPRDHLSALRWRLGNGRVNVSNAWHRAAGHRIHGARGGIGNARSRRTLERGRAPRLTGANAAVSSRLPVYRSRVNPATGRPHRDDARLHRTGNEGLARLAPQRQRDAQAARGRASR